jgi:hypothetical protein
MVRAARRRRLPWLLAAGLVVMVGSLGLIGLNWLVSKDVQAPAVPWKVIAAGFFGGWVLAMAKALFRRKYNPNHWRRFRARCAAQARRRGLWLREDFEQMIASQTEPPPADSPSGRGR